VKKRKIKKGIPKKTPEDFLEIAESLEVRMLSCY